MKDEKMSAEKKYIYRQEKCRPILDHWHAWLLEHAPLTLAKSPIGLAIRYVLRHWDGLRVYLTDGRIESDNNATERDIKPFVIGRKNFLFACTQKGADSLAVQYSLIVTAKHHGLNPVEYYEAVLDRLPTCVSFEDYSKLLPWNIQL